MAEKQTGQFYPVQEAFIPIIKIIGVGGAGGNVVTQMAEENFDQVETIICNTDIKALKRNKSHTKIELGKKLTRGMGAGARPEVGEGAAEESLEEINEAIEGANMVFIAAGMGGGTGTGAAPVIAKAARERGILTVGCVTKPFQFEGKNRMRLAEEGISELQKSVDTLIVIPNQNLFRVANAQTTFSDAFKMADKVLYSGVRGVTDLMVMPGVINLDFADVRSVMMEMGKAMMGTGDAEGDNRALEAAAAAIANPLLDDVSLAGARGVLVNVTGGPDLTLFEVDEIVDHIRQQSDDEVNLIFGASQDDSMHNNIRVSVVATGIDCEKRVDPVENVISDINTNELATNIANGLELDENINKNNISNKEEAANIEYRNNSAREEVLEKVIEIKQESFIPPEPEILEKEVITQTEIKIDPFTEAEVLNASSSIEDNSRKNEEVNEIKETESLIKRFTGKSIFGNTNKKNNESSEKIEVLENNINNELSFSQDISMKSTEKNSNEDALDIPAFLRRQRE